MRRGCGEGGEREDGATARTETLLDVRPYFCIATLSSPSPRFLADFIINYLNAFDSRTIPPRSSPPFPR